MKNRDIVVVGLQSWDSEIGSNCKNIALEFAKQNRVLFVNRALDRVSRWKGKSDPKIQRRIKSLKGEISDLEQVSDNLWSLDPRITLESINWMPSFVFPFFNKLNNRRIANAIRDACQRLGFNDIVLFIDNDFFRAQYLPEMLDAKGTIYYIRDYLINQEYFKKHGASSEISLIRKADVVVANSSYLAEYTRRYNPNSFDIGQGCDLSLFNSDLNYQQPGDLNKIPAPVIGYVGALVGYRLDIDLLVTLAKENTGWNWVFVGPEDEMFKGSSLHKYDNVFFLGRKKESELAAYVYHFDVCINPQLVNEVTIGNYPRKVDEYLALEKPVVATYTDFMKSFSRYVYLCRNATEYQDAIRKSLQEKGNEEEKKGRRAFALTHTWENSVNKLYEAFNNRMSSNEK